jgi:hypothetical protein
VEEALVRREVEQAGFKLVEQGSFLRNPADPRDRNTPDPPQPKDEFVLKFVKPEGGSDAQRGPCLVPGRPRPRRLRVARNPDDVRAALP